MVPAPARRVGQTIAQREPGAIAEAVGPVVQGRAAAAAALGDLLRAVAGGAPAPGGGAPAAACLGGGSKPFPPAGALPAGEVERSQGPSLRGNRAGRADSRGQRTFWNLLSPRRSRRYDNPGPVWMVGAAPEMGT